MTFDDQYQLNKHTAVSVSQYVDLLYWLSALCNQADCQYDSSGWNIPGYQCHISLKNE